MTDHLTRLAARTLGLMPVVQPLIPSRYAPSTQTFAGGLEITEERQVTEQAMSVPDRSLRHATPAPVPDSRIGVAEETAVLEQGSQAPERSAEAAAESRLPERAPPPDQPRRYPPDVPVPDSKIEVVEESRPEQRVKIPAPESNLNVISPPSPDMAPAASAVANGQTSMLDNQMTFQAGTEIMRKQIATAVPQGAIPTEVLTASLPYRQVEPEQLSGEGIETSPLLVPPSNKTDLAVPNAESAATKTPTSEHPVFGMPPVLPTMTAAATTSLQPDGTVTGKTVASHPANRLSDDVAVAPDKGISRPPAVAVQRTAATSLQPEPPVASTTPATPTNSLRQKNTVVVSDEGILYPPVATAPPAYSISSEGRRPTSYPDKSTEVSTRPEANLLPSEPPSTWVAGRLMGDRLPQQFEQQALLDSGKATPVAPTVHVTIGRIEVRAVTPPPAPVAKSTTRRSGPALSLDDYLKLRNGPGR